MARYSKEHNEFAEAIKDVKKELKETVTPDAEGKIPAVRTAVRFAKLVSRPENLPKAIIAHELLKKEASVTEDVNPIHLRDILMEGYGVEWLDWLPEVLDRTVFEGEHNQVLSNKIQALRISMTTDSPWLDWPIFENVGQSFNHEVPLFDLFQPLSLGECATTMWTLKEIRDEEFSAEILIYIATVALHDNYVYIPEELPIAVAQKYLTPKVHDQALIEQVRKAWAVAKDKDLLSAQYKDDDPVHRQIAKLALLKQYYIEFQE